MCYMNKPFILNIMSFKNNYLNDSFLYVSPQLFGIIGIIFGGIISGIIRFIYLLKDRNFLPADATAEWLLSFVVETLGVDFLP